MAFSATARGFAYMGQLRCTYGDWSGAAGDAAGTINVAGRFIGSLWFKNDTTAVNNQTNQVFPAVNWDGNASPGALTVQNQDNVTNGSFLLFSLGQ